MATLLSQYKVTNFIWGKSNYSNKFLSQTISNNVELILLYSDSAENIDNVFFFYFPQNQWLT